MGNLKNLIDQGPQQRNLPRYHSPHWLCFQLALVLQSSLSYLPKLRINWPFRYLNRYLVTIKYDTNPGIMRAVGANIRHLLYDSHAPRAVVRSCDLFHAAWFRFLEC